MSDDTDLSIYQQCHEKAKSHIYLYHYTSFEALLSIIDNRKIRLSNLSLLNDPLEYERLSIEPMEQNRIYVCCFNHFSKERLPLWKMYADGPYGIRIGFPRRSAQFFENILNYECGSVDHIIFLNDDNPRRKWKLAYASLVDVIYDDDFQNYIKLKKIYPIDELPELQRAEAIGHLKKECWEFEEETRIIVGLKPDRDLGNWIDKEACEYIRYAAPPYKFVYCKIPEEALLDIRIMFNPQSSDSLMEMMKNELRRSIPGFKDENFQKSDIVIGGC
jgi:hypothetical protein